MKARVIREYYVIRYGHALFGARPDQTHPDMVAHPLSDGRYVVEEADSMSAAYIAAHRVIGSTLAEPKYLAGRSMAPGGVDVLRVAEIEPCTVQDANELVEFGILPPSRTITHVITGTEHIAGIPHFASAGLSRYDPVNGWPVPSEVDVF